MHLYPRYVDDPFPGKAIDYRQTQDWFGIDGFQVFVEALQNEISRLW
jgi:hypothetical protein